MRVQRVSDDVAPADERDRSSTRRKPKILRVIELHFVRSISLALSLLFSRVVTTRALLR